MTQPAQIIFTEVVRQRLPTSNEDSMFRFLFAIALTATILAGSAMSAEMVKADAAYGVKYAQERVVKLPQDGNRFFCTIIGTNGEARYESLKTWFSEVPELKAFAKQTHFNKYATQSTEFKQRYHKTAGKTFPLVRVLTADGKKLLELRGDEIPMSGEALTKHLNTECIRRWRQRCQPHRQPDNTVPDEENQDEDEDLPNQDEPDVEPSDEPDMLFLGLLICGCLVAGFGGAGVNAWKKRNASIK